MSLKILILIVLIALIKYVFKLLDKDVYVNELDFKFIGLHLKISTKTKDEPPTTDSRPKHKK